MASEIHSIHPAPAPPRMSLWHRQHPTKTDTEKLVLNTHTHIPHTLLCSAIQYIPKSTS